MARPDINDVFTPRASKINPYIYVSRPALELELQRALRGSLHTIVYGDSGCGKSWLYKKVIADLGWPSTVANCANAARLGAISKEILSSSPPLPQETSYTETKGVSAGAKLEHAKKYDVSASEPLMSAFEAMGRQTNGTPFVLVLDNLEAIFKNPALMEELGNIIILLDDDRYARFRVKILIVGVPSGVIEYFSKLANPHTVANRIQEISEVAGLSEEECNQLTQRGLREQLHIDIDAFEFQNWQDHIFAVTIGVPQRVHEYCEQLAYVAKDAGWKGKLNHIDKADKAWLRMGLKESYQVVEGLMNERKTTAGRRNQVLYALGRMNSRTFTTSRVEDVLRNHFPKSTENIALGVSQILGEVAEREHSIIKRTPKGDAYQFTDARYQMALRAMLKGSDDERVTRIEL
jgi:hypothetical protein